MPTCMVCRRRGFEKSLTMQGICRNTLNPQEPWHYESSASAACVLASLSIWYMLCSHWGCVSIGSGLPGCGPGLEPDRMVQSGLLPGKQGYPPGSGTGWNRTAVPYYGSFDFGSN